jgi:hypothetical protein
MPTTLQDLQRQIAQREQELQVLREELQTRQSQLTELTRRKQELQRQLQQVEKEIAAFRTSTPATAEPVEPVTPAPPPTPPPPASIPVQPKLAELIVTVLREAAQPLTARQLSEEARRRGFPLTGQNPVKSVEARVQELKHKGIVQRASGQPGYALVPSANGARRAKGKPRRPAQTGTRKTPAKPVKSASTAKKRNGTAAPAAGAGKTVPPGRRGGRPPLRVVLTDILKSSRTPLSGSELAQRAQAAGYQSTSTRFVDSVWSMLAQMENVEHVPQQGYRLKRT